MFNDLIRLKYVEKIRRLLLLIHRDMIAHTHTYASAVRFRSLARLLFVCCLYDVCLWTTLTRCIEWERERERLDERKFDTCNDWWWSVSFQDKTTTMKRNVQIKREEKEKQRGSTFLLSFSSEMILLRLMWLESHEWTHDTTNTTTTKVGN